MWPISYSEKKVSLLDAVEAVAKLGGRKIEINRYAVFLIPKDAPEKLVTWEFLVPPDFVPRPIQGAPTLGLFPSPEFATNVGVSTVSAIKQSNGLSGDTIYVGQRLLVPIGTNVPNPPTPPPPSSSTAERIQFRSGATSDTRGGYTSAIAPKRYVLRAAAGQQMTVALKTTSAFVHLVIVAPNSGLLVTSDRALQSWTGELPLDGDYTVEVRNNGQGNADFGITVTILGRTSSSVPCLATSPVRRTYVDPDKQYCLLYPSAFQLKDAAIGRIGIYGPPLDQTSEPVFAAVMIYNEGPANGTSLEEVVNIYVQNHAEGAVAARQPTTLGGEAAIRVAGLPGRTGSRHIFVVHAGMVYHLSFYPVDPAFPQVATDMQTLWQTVMESFSFMR